MTSNSVLLFKLIASGARILCDTLLVVFEAEGEDPSAIALSELVSRGRLYFFLRFLKLDTRLRNEEGEEPSAVALPELIPSRRLYFFLKLASDSSVKAPGPLNMGWQRLRMNEMLRLVRMGVLVRSLDLLTLLVHMVLLEKKKLEYERLREQKRRFKAEMQLLDLQQRREEQELAQMQEDLGRSNKRFCSTRFCWVRFY
ncbi:hypothetical protein L207DRAFT_538340 [Hyaloscypha variabilis F]|uniref:Uncharacterized protein n=1 Tax=Hyaloscypha variabilis (strain UAMH 11265 / GT02V1 / F) TaxID=1149755 RepID=A0A2J6QUD8_HYAVF|nr:hypothetical protein L207DRAFT_538340 [Hyaloscypha variabilis F]